MLEKTYVLFSTVCIIVLIIFYFCHYFGMFPTPYIKDIKENVREASLFKGYVNLTDKPNEVIKYNLIDTLVSNRMDNNSNNHFIVYGASGSGKTFFIKTYVKKFSSSEYIVFCKDKDEWKDAHNVYGSDQLHTLNIPENFINKIIILDDMGNNLTQKTLSEIYTYGRHYNIQIIVMAHKAKDIDNKIRDNIYTFFITVNNPFSFFDEIKKTYSLPYDLKRFVEIDFGIIKVETNKNIFKVYDKDYNKYYDSKSNNKVSLMKLSDIKNYYNSESINDPLVRDDIKYILECASNDTINITDQTFYFYLYCYYKQIGLRLKMPKLKKLVTESMNNGHSIIYNIRETIGNIKPIVKEGLELKRDIVSYY